MLFRLLVALAIGLPLGAWTAWSAIRTDIGIGALKVAEWTAWPKEGSPDADPYTKAKVAAEGAVPLGVGEGVAFEAVTDHDNRPLDLRCDYVISGRTPKARVWTLTAHQGGVETRDGPPLRRPDGQVAAMTSRDLVRREDGSFAIALGTSVMPGDWIALTAPVEPQTRPRATPEEKATLPFRVVLRLYDSPVSTSAELFEPVMPTIERRRCR